MNLNDELLTSLPFPPLTKSHILNCSFHSWYSKYKSITPKARLISLPDQFISYLRADGIVLPHEPSGSQQWSDNDSGIFSGAEGDFNEDDEDEDPAIEWRDTHNIIRNTITELDGNVIPKLNWSTPKDATWISATNSLECHTPDDIYLLLKSSDFITHDLEHAFDDCINDGETSIIQYHLVLRKYFQLNPALEFRCFVRKKNIIGITQRDLNYFEFLSGLKNNLRDKILDFFEDKLFGTFPDENFVFDVYIPPPHKKVWLIDINPWAGRTDPLLFSWLELLTMDGFDKSEKMTENGDEQLQEDDVESIQLLPEFRLVGKDDPEAYNFSSTKYGAHKLPKDVIDASTGGESALREFADRWKDLIEKSSNYHDVNGSNDEE